MVKGWQPLPNICFMLSLSFKIYTVKTDHNDADSGAMVTPWCHMNILVLWEHHSALP